MAIMDWFPPTGSGSGGGGNIPGPVTLGVQRFTLNGATQTIDGTLGPVIFISGSAPSSQINFPSAVTAGATFFIATNATVQWTLGATAGTVDGAATKPMNGPAIFESDGTNWISSSVTTYLGDTRWALLAGANVLAGSNTFNAQIATAGQTFAATGSISDSAGSVVTFTGSTAAQTLTLSATPTTGRLMWLRNEATVSVTIASNGKNIDGTASISIPLGGSGLIWYDGATWWGIGPCSWQTLTWGAAQIFSSAVTVSGNLSANGTLNAKATFTWGRQSFSGNGSPTSSGGTIWAYTGTAGATLTIPGTITGLDQVIVVKDEGGNAGTNNVIVSGVAAGLLIDGATTKVISSNFGSFRMYYNGVNLFTF